VPARGVLGTGLDPAGAANVASCFASDRDRQDAKRGDPEHEPHASEDNGPSGGAGRDPSLLESTGEPPYPGARMEPETYTRRLWALWLLLPPTALDFWVRSGSLPVVATDSLLFTLGVFAFMLAGFTAVGYLILFMRPDRALPALVVICLAMGIVFVVMNVSVWTMSARHR